MSESHVATVTDPAGGAYAVEKLTDDLAVSAWDLFGRLEGGADLDELIAATVDERDRQVATRARPITGLTEFPNLFAELPERAPAHTRREVRRYGAAFEALQDAPMNEPVFLATMGTVAPHTARATFATNLFAARWRRCRGGGARPTASTWSKRTAASQWCAWQAPMRPTRAWGDAAAAHSAGPARTGSSLPGSRADRLARGRLVAMGVDALAFLRRTRERLA